MDVVDDVGPGKFPRIAEGEPFFRIFLLPSAANDLAEQAMIVADAVAASRNSERRHAFHEAGGESAKTAIAQSRIRFGGSERVEIDAQIAKRRVEQLRQTEIAKSVAEKPPNHEFQRKIIDALLALRVALALARQPAMRNAVANGKRGGNEPIAIGGHRRVFSDGKRQFREHRALHFADAGIIARDGRRSCKGAFSSNLAGQRLAPQYRDWPPPTRASVHRDVRCPTSIDEMRKCDLCCGATYNAACAKTSRAALCATTRAAKAGRPATFAMLVSLARKSPTD